MALSSWLLSLLGAAGGGFEGMAADQATAAKRRRESFGDTMSSLEMQDRYGLIPKDQADAKRDLARTTAGVMTDPANPFPVVMAARAAQLSQAPTWQLPTGPGGAFQPYIADKMQSRFAREESQKAADRKAIVDEQVAGRESAKQQAAQQAKDAHDALASQVSVIQSTLPATHPWRTLDPTKLNTLALQHIVDNVKPKLESQAMTVDGKAVLGFRDTEGNFYDSNRQPIRGAVTPYAADRPGAWKSVVSQDKDKNPIYLSYNEHTGEYKRPDQEGFTPPPPKGAAGGAGSQQNMQSRLLGAVSEGRLADERMGKFEQEHAKDGKLDVSMPGEFAGDVAARQAGTHNLVAGGVGKIAEMYSARVHPDVLQYQRDARLIARAEQLMAARGGSEAMASDNAFLARSPGGAPLSMVQAAQKSRKALFGKLGAVMQTLTPEQQSKLAEGLAALQSDNGDFDYGKLGKDIGLDRVTAPAPQGGRAAGAGPGRTGGPSGLDDEIAIAMRAIANGASVADVRRRFKQRTGQDLPQ